MKFLNLFVCLLFSFLANPYLNALSAAVDPHPEVNSFRTYYIQKPGHIYVNFTHNDSSSIHDIDLTEMLDVIVEFKEPPLFLNQQSSGLKKINTAMYQTLLSKFSNDIIELHKAVQKQFNTSFTAPQKKEEFH